MTLGDAPSLMTLVYTSCHESLVCVGYKHQFDLISEAGDVSRIHSIDKQKVLYCFSGTSDELCKLVPIVFKKEKKHKISEPPQVLDTYAQEYVEDIDACLFSCSVFFISTLKFPQNQLTQ